MSSHYGSHIKLKLLIIDRKIENEKKLNENGVHLRL